MYHICTISDILRQGVDSLAQWLEHWISTPAVRVRIKIIVRSFGSSKITKLEDGPYCTISGNEPSSVTLYKTGSKSQSFCCNFKNLHLCSLNQRHKFPKGPNNQNTVKKMILNI